MSITVINTENFQNEVVASDKPVLIDFWASWCGPCRMLSPIVEELANEHPEIKVGKVNVDDEPELARQFQIQGIPALILFKNGKPVAHSVGVKPKAEIEEILR